MISTCGNVRVGRLHGIAEGVASIGMDGDEVLTDDDKVRDDDTHAVPRTMQGCATIKPIHD